MENENKSKQCYMCRYFDRYYTKGVKQYDKTQFGSCGVKKESVCIHETCDEFVRKHVTNKVSILTQACLNDMLTQISEIRKIIEDRGCEEDV